MLELVKPTPSRVSYREFGLNKLEGLVRGLGLEHRLEAANRLFDLLTSSWGVLPMGATPLWSSDITDDGTPFELSVAFSGGKPLIRVLAEAQCAPYDVESNWEAGLALTRQLAALGGVDSARLERIQALFAPSSGSDARFAIWHAGTVEADGSLSFKVYLNPRIVGPSLAPELVREALSRLGADYAWDELAPKLTGKSEVLYFSLDLSKSADARVKVYVGHPYATSADVDAVVRDESGYTPGLAQSWIEELTGAASGFNARPILTCHAFRSPLDAAEVTVHVPTRCYVDDDGESVLRAGELLGPGAPALRAGVEGMAGRPLEMGRGLVTYVSLRPTASGTRLTAYLAPEAYAISTPRRSTHAPAARRTLAPPSFAPASVLPARADASVAPLSSLPAPVASMIRDLGIEVANDSLETFATVERVIASHRAQLATHSFLARLEGEGSLEEVRTVASRLTFYVMCFQDMLRTARMLTTDPVLKEFAVNHEAEDYGHDQWFLNDLAILGAERDLAWTFSADHAATRDVAYRIIAQIVSASHDATRLAVLLALEAVGAEFFGRIIGFLDRQGRSEGLRYFARSHQAVEQSHDVFEHDSQSRLGAVVVPEHVLPEVLLAVSRTFQAMATLGDDLERAMRASATPRDVAGRRVLRVAG